MKKVCENWEQALSATKFGPEYFEEFEKRAKQAAAEIFRVKTAAEAKEIIINLVKFTNAKKIVSVYNPLQHASGINEELKVMGVENYTDKCDIAAHAETADIGISGVEFGVAETGSVCQDAYAVESRLVSTLPPIHVVFLNSNLIVPGVEDAFTVFSTTYDRGYLSLITGPSRTADIERVLTIGVHGPSRFIIIAVDEPVIGGAA
jgi:L-lactate dehydrogenase complex protein LldG